MLNHKSSKMRKKNTDILSFDFKKKKKKRRDPKIYVDKLLNGFSIA